jgi:hypothetical protein
MHDPSDSQSLPRLGCLWGTFSPSRCQIRSTRLSLIIQPACFAMEDRDTLVRKLGSQAKIIWDDIADTIGPFRDSIEPSAPLSFISIDVDIYSATKAAPRCLASRSDKYNPAVSMYFDDASFFFANEWAGELAAIAEFNEEHGLRNGRDRSLSGRRPIKVDGWYSAMYVCHGEFMAPRFLFCIEFCNQVRWQA